MLSWTIGAVKVTAILEATYDWPVGNLLPDASFDEAKTVDWLHPRFVNAQGDVQLWVQAFVVDTPSRRIVVDTCMGNDKVRFTPESEPLRTDFLQRFEAAGFARESIDVVLCTHLHVDHVGWNTMLEDGKWVPTFPRARYLIGRVEFGFWRDLPDNGDAAILAESVQPIIDAGLVDFVEADHVVCDEIMLVPTPGHTPGHVSVSIVSLGQRALITGDMMHTPAQIARPDWASFVDQDPAGGIVTRRRLLGDLAAAPVLVIGTHFPAPTAGYIEADGAGFRFRC